MKMRRWWTRSRAAVRLYPLLQETSIHVANRRATVLTHIISQLRPGADLSRVTLPTFILEPRSMLERITKCVVRRG
jgi:hypothetical protein